MLQVIIIILAVSFILYTILGGADFGAGILEIFAGRRGEKTVSKAIAPVWEANHVWLILAIVIIFTAFPLVYATLSLSLHIPLMIVLIGIVLRGTAFTFRYYDVSPDKTHKYFTGFFEISSFITPFFLGITLGAMILGEIPPDNAGSFSQRFYCHGSMFLRCDGFIYDCHLWIYRRCIFNRRSKEYTGTKKIQPAFKNIFIIDFCHGHTGFFKC
ncbi:MAG: cytochrome d ubiquinol oxidase subunit II [Chitinophagaceae bacterium]|nr:cytochrome d ubiquinol oxidase subunit II [Chitinophagaceae bacterium]